MQRIAYACYAVIATKEQIFGSFDPQTMNSAFCIIHGRRLSDASHY
jgi:hypothetical protein